MPEVALVTGLWYCSACWFDYYPVLLALVALVWRLRLLPGRQLLSGLNVATAGAGLLWLLASSYEVVRSWYSQVEFEQYAFVNRVAGPYWWAYWAGVLPMLGSQWLWWPRLRHSFGWSFGYMLLTLLLPVVERLFVLIVSAHRDYLPSSWAMLTPDALLRWPLYVVALALLLWLRPWRNC